MSKKVFLMLASCIIVWGVGVPILKIGVMSMNIHVYSFMRFIVSSVICIIIMWFKKDFIIDKKDILPMICIGFLFVFLQQKLYNEGTYKTTAGNNALICALIPVITICINGMLKLEKIKIQQIIGILVSLAGIIFVVLGNEGEVSLSNTSLVGDIMITIAIALWVVYAIINKKYVKKYSSAKVIAYTSISGTFFMFIFWCDEILSTSISEISYASWLNIIVTGILMTTIVNILWNQCVKEVGSTKTSIYYNLSPILSIIIGVIWLKEKFTYIMFIGSFITICGVLITQIKSFGISRKKQYKNI